MKFSSMDLIQLKLGIKAEKRAHRWIVNNQVIDLLSEIISRLRIALSKFLWDMK